MEKDIEKLNLKSYLSAQKAIIEDLYIPKMFRDFISKLESSEKDSQIIQQNKKALKK